MRGRRHAPTLAKVLGILALVGSTPILRAEPGPAEIATARRLFSEATELRTAGSWAEASSKLREAIAIKETAGLRFHLAHCEEKLGRLVQASRDYDRASELLLAGAKAPDVEAPLAAARAALAERVPSLLIKVPVAAGDTAQASVSIDGVSLPLAEAGKPIPLDPGTHTVVASQTGRASFSLEVRLTEGEDRVVEVTLPPLAPPPVAAPSRGPLRDARRDAPHPASGSSFGAREALLIGEGALALGGAAVGVVFLVKRGQASARIDDAGRRIGTRATVTDPTTNDCVAPVGAVAAACRDLGDALDERRRDGTIAEVAFIAGGAGLAAGAVTWLVWPRARAEHALLLSPAPGGVTLNGVF